MHRKPHKTVLSLGFWELGIWVGEVSQLLSLAQGFVQIADGGWVR